MAKKPNKKKQVDERDLIDNPIPGLIKDDDEDHTLESAEPRRIVLLGSSHLASHISLHLMRLHNMQLYVIDRKDPNQIFLNPEMKNFYGDPRITTLYWSEKDFETNFIDLQRSQETKADIIINTINIQDEQYSDYNPLETMNINTVFTTALMDSLRKSDWDGVLMHMSTAKVYGYRSKQSIDIPKIKEDTLCQPLGIKAVSRYCQELIINHLSETYGTKFLIFRLGTLYGHFTPSDGVLNTWLRAMLTKSHVRLHGMLGSESRDFTSIFDVAEFVLQLVNRGKFSKNVLNGIYNIGSNVKNETRLKNVADAIVGFLKPYSPDSKIIRSDYRYEEERDYREFLDCSKATTMLGYHPKVEFDVLRVLMKMPIVIAKEELRLDDESLYEISILCNRPDEQAKMRLLKKKGLNPLTNKASEFLENFTAGITAKSQEIMKGNLTSMLNDKDRAAILKKYMEENELSITDISSMVTNEKIH